METVAGNGLLRNVEVGIDKHGPCHPGRTPLSTLSQLEGFAPGVFYIMGTITQRYDVYVNLLPKSELRPVEKVLRLFASAAG